MATVGFKGLNFWLAVSILHTS